MEGQSACTLGCSALQSLTTHHDPTTTPSRPHHDPTTTPPRHRLSMKPCCGMWEGTCVWLQGHPAGTWVPRRSHHAGGSPLARTRAGRLKDWVADWMPLPNEEWDALHYVSGCEDSSLFGMHYAHKSTKELARQLDSHAFARTAAGDGAAYFVPCGGAPLPDSSIGTTAAFLALLAGRNVVFLGDSLSRQHFMATVFYLIGPLFDGPPKNRATTAQLPPRRPSTPIHRIEALGDLARECVALPFGPHRTELCFISPAGLRQMRLHTIASASTLTRASEAGWLGAHDFLVANLGLHHGRQAWENVSHAISAFADAFEALPSAVRPALIWRETSPQHFRTPHGWFEGTGEAVHGSRWGCEPLQEPTSPAHDYFNNLSTPILAALAQRVPRVWLLRIWAESAPRWQDHFGHGPTRALRSMLDCTHFCLPGSTLEHWAAKLVFVISSDGADARFTPPSSPQLRV